MKECLAETDSRSMECYQKNSEWLFWKTIKYLGIRMSQHISLVAALVICLSGCSSIVSKSDYPVSINSSPDGAAFVITNRSGETVHSGNTPSTIILKSSAGYFKGESYKVMLNKVGFSPKEYTLNSSVDGWYFGNLLLGGLIGMLIVDPITGAMYNLPARVDVSLDSQSVSIDSGVLTIASIDSLSPQQLAKLVPIK